MRNIYLSEKSISEIFWKNIAVVSDRKKAEDDARLIVEETKSILKLFPSEVAGSISLRTTVSLWLIARYFQPKYIFEIGTFIGRSTLALLAGGGDQLIRLDTCDASFDQFELTDTICENFSRFERLNYWPKTRSDEALSKVISLGAKPDMLFIDGRLTDHDIENFRQLDPQSIIFVFDDFEGTEKGVENCLRVRRELPQSVLIRPTQESDHGPERLALLVPPKIIKFSRQQDLPIDLY